MLKHVGSNWALALVQIVVLVQLKPVQIAALGVETQGAWLTIASLTSALGLLILGLPPASVRFIARHVAKGEHEKANEAVASCLGISLILGMVALLAGALLYPVFDRVYLQAPAFATLGPAVIAGAKVAYWLAVLQVGLGFGAQVPFGILEAHHDFFGRNGVRLAGLALRLVLTIVVLRRWPSLVVMGWIQLAILAGELGTTLLLIRRRWPKVRIRLRKLERVRVREILGFSLYAMALMLGTQLSFQADQLVINGSAGPGQGTLFDVGNTFFPPLVGLVVGIASVVMPTATKLQAVGDHQELGRLLLRWSKASYSIALLVGVYLLVLGPEFIGWWMGPSFAGPSGAVTRVLMASFLVFLPVRGVSSALLLGIGKPRGAALAFVLMGVGNVALSVALVGPLGIVGVALGTAIPSVACAAVLMVASCREAGVPVARFVGHVFGKPTLGALPAVALLVWLKHGARIFPRAIEAPRGLATLIPLVAAGLGMVLVFALAWVLFVYRHDEDAGPLQKLERYLPAALRGRAR